MKPRDDVLAFTAARKTFMAVLTAERGNTPFLRLPSGAVECTRIRTWRAGNVGFRSLISGFIFVQIGLQNWGLMGQILSCGGCISRRTVVEAISY